MYAVIRSDRLRFAINIYQNSEDVLHKKSTKGSLPRDSTFQIRQRKFEVILTVHRR